MTPELLGYFLALLYGILCLSLAVILSKLGLSKNYCRKAVHILVGFEWVILYAFMGVSIHFLIVCLAFLSLLSIIYFKKSLPMISSDGDNAPGTVYYCVAMSIMAFVCLFVPKMMLPFGIGVFCTSFGDGFAGLVGQSIKKCNPKLFRNKTLFGALANFLFSFAAAEIFTLNFDMGLTVWQCILIAAMSVMLELLGVFGLDNILVTLSTSFLAYAFMYLPWINSYIAPIMLTPLVIILVIERKALTAKGLVVAIILDFVISLTLKNFGFVLLLSFLFLSIAVDKAKKFAKHEDTITKKGECRDEIQVIANGLVPMLLAVVCYFAFNPVFLVAYVAVLAEAFADTAASGIGVFSKNTFDLFKMRRCEKGISGGMSFLGTSASLVGAVLFSLLILPFGIKSFTVILIASLSAFLGVIFDSFLGSVLQVKYRCSVCSFLTERESHCDAPTVKARGFKFFDNDVVNVSSGVFTAIISIVLSSLIF